MQLKRTVTLGILVFFVGILMTACGSDSSPAAAPAGDTTTNTTNNNNLPFPTATGTATCATECGQTFQVRLQVTDQEAFSQLVGLNTNSGGYDLSGIDLFDGNFQPEREAISQCLWSIGMAAVIKWITNGEVDASCSGTTTTTTTTTTGTGTVASHYGMVLQPQSGDVYQGSIYGAGFNNLSFYAPYNSTSGLYESTNSNTTLPFGISRDANGVLRVVTQINGQTRTVGTVVR